MFRKLCNLANPGNAGRQNQKLQMLTLQTLPIQQKLELSSDSSMHDCMMIVLKFVVVLVHVVLEPCAKVAGVVQLNSLGPF